MKDRPEAILALEQGLGKTVVAALDVEAPAIVVCTSAMKYTWADELALWRPDLRTQVIETPNTKVDPSADVHIINFDILKKVKLPWPETLVVDEAQKIKTATAARTKAVLAMVHRVDRVRFLTGTPMLSRPVELFPILSAIGAVSSNWDRYTRRYCNAWNTPWGNRDVSGHSNLDELAEVVAPYMLRMTKAQVAPQIPAKSYRIVSFKGTIGKQEHEFLDYLDEHLRLPSNPIAFQAISDIRRIHAEKKLPQAIDYIRGLLEETDSDKKIVVFAHHRESVDGIAEALKKFGVVTIKGGVSAKAARDVVHAFQNDSKVRLFVGNLQAAGEGITLTASNHVVIVEPSWVPGEISQAADRCHRLTTKFPVTVDLLTVQGSIDARMIKRVIEKQEVIDRVIKETIMTDYTKIVEGLKTMSEVMATLADEFEALADTNVPAEETKTTRTRRSAKAKDEDEEAPKTTRRTRSTKAKDEDEDEEEAPKTTRRTRSAKVKDEDEEEAPKTTRRTRASKAKDEDEGEDEAPKSKGPTLAEVRRVSSKLIAMRKRDVLQEILEDFDADDLADLKEEDYAEFIDEVTREL